MGCASQKPSLGQGVTCSPCTDSHEAPDSGGQHLVCYTIHLCYEATALIFKFPCSPLEIKDYFISGVANLNFPRIMQRVAIYEVHLVGTVARWKVRTSFKGSGPGSCHTGGKTGIARPSESLGQSKSSDSYVKTPDF